jgi:DNA repair exonuclease SbcCD ATPase subunit
MLYLKGLDLHNVVTFKELSVDFDQNLTYVRGLNLDSDQASPTSNGAGKTLMFSAIANLLYQTTPLALKKKSKKDILRHKGSSVGLILSPSTDGPEYEIIQTSNSYKIYENGVDLELRTIPLAEEFIRELFPLSETKFYSTCYLSTQRPYLLQRDTDSNRLQHISDIFNLDMYDGIRESLAIRLRSIKDHEIKLSVLEQNVIALRKKIADLNSDVGETSYKKYKSRYEKYSKQLEELQSKRFALSSRLRDLNSLLSIERKLDDLRSQYSFKKPPTEMLKHLKRQRESSVLWDRYTHKLTHAKKLRSKLEGRLAELPSIDKDESTIRYEIKRIAAKIRELDVEISNLSALKKSYTRNRSELAAMLDRKNELGVSNVDLEEDYDSEIAVHKATIKLERLLEHTHDDTPTCPTCLSTLDIAAIKKAVSSAKKKLSKLHLYSEAQEVYKRISELKESCPEYDASLLSSLQDKQQAFQKRLDKLNSDLETLSSRNSIQSQLDEIEFPNKPEVDKPTHSLNDLDSHMDLCSSIVETLAAKDALLSNHEDLASLRSEASVNTEIESVRVEMSTLDSDISKLRAEQSKLAASISSYEQYKNTSNVYEVELRDTEAKIAEIKPEVSDKKLFDILLKAYGTKGLRSSAANSVCQLLQTNLNHYRDLIFAEPFTFEVSASESGVSMLVDRNNGKSDSVSDVRNLSGAESNSFQLLCLMSLLTLLPDNDRVNLVVLDEPTSHMDSVSREIFNERFLPVLREIVPSVYVISPHSDDVCPNSNEWIVQKKSGISSLL